MYNKEYKNLPFVTSDPSAPIDFHVVQADDQGSFWSTSVADGVLGRVAELAASQNIFVVLFIHGWHHSAAPDDVNMRDFHKSLLELDKQLAHPDRTAFRARHTGSPDVRVVGIFVGWRGRSLPSLLDYLTFWGRKRCAERVGEGDVGEFLLRLQRIYLRANCKQENGRYTGLVCIGHSFGGQALWKSLQRGVEAELAERTAQMSNSLYPDAGGGPMTTAYAPADAFGDLNVLLNPALEAYQYARIDSLFRKIQFPNTQVPQVITFTATSDLARRFWFWAARILMPSLHARFRPDNDRYQRELYGRALGELDPQVTHTLEPAGEGTADTLTHEVLEPGPDGVCPLWKTDFTDDQVLHGLRLQRVEGPGLPVRFSPVAVIRTNSKKVIKGHNGIFQLLFTEFLRHYVAYIEAKRVLVWKSRHRTS
jgi:hypothetical protein